MNRLPCPSQNERLIVALDVSDNQQARQLVEILGETVSVYKIGLELLMSGEFFELVRWLQNREKRIFADIKFFDVPATVARAVRNLARWGVDFATVHGNQAMMEAANQEKGDMCLLAVTALTSLDQHDLQDLGFSCNPEELVVSRAHRAIEAGLDGVVCSGLETRTLRQVLGSRFLIATPGIRPVVNTAPDDQKRVSTAWDALAAGADYVVVGRPVRDAVDPRRVAESLQQEIRDFSNDAHPKS
jgi:orotidine-5'-phosphate decarboxylase